MAADDKSPKGVMEMGYETTLVSRLSPYCKLTWQTHSLHFVLLFVLVLYRTWPEFQMTCTSILTGYTRASNNFL